MMIDLEGRLDDDTDLAKAKKWRNLWFLKDGRTCLGVRTFESEDAADKWASDWKEFRILTLTIGRIPTPEVSHYIPVPIGGGE